MVSTFIALLTIAATASSPLVDTATLSTMEDCIIVDTRTEEEYREEHILHAFQLDTDILSETRSGTLGMLKPKREVETLLYRAGVRRGKTIVLYSGMASSVDLKRASRLFWILETMNFTDVKVLDGGLAKWKGEERDLCSDHASAKTTGEVPDSAYTATMNNTIATQAAVCAVADAGNGTILDLRSPALYSGESKKDFVDRAGHIEGADNIPAAQFMEGEYFTFKSEDALRSLFSAEQLAQDHPVITYCNSGRDATVGYLGLRVLGHRNVSVYDGSMAEWGNDPAMKMSTSVSNPGNN